MGQGREVCPQLASKASLSARALLSINPTDLNGHSNLERALINLGRTAVTSRGVR